ncbi:uncharacterized protein [Blastocystis hominis]|uniref:Uncharacterized protein n=1 Tax=Blastocystis hominis TaxID=12968 RepID=D8LY00_BLAHO|nr:uncharacterized protein [Blastocystis hominis]CBK20455.2 unnamed protein product [Blastocystis hominis]|eukprot:XP_012894503.1 uncharacterized protein [Blastocystis hominis]
MEHLPTLLDAVEKKCPKLRPVFLPNGISEKEAIRKYSEKHALPKPNKKCDICGDKEGEYVPQVFCTYDLKTRKCIITEVKNVCQQCKFSMNIQKIMELLVKASTSTEEVGVMNSMSRAGRSVYSPFFAG